MYRLIASDLDETLLNDEHQICEANRQAIKEATARGIKFVPATGRGYTSITNVLEALDLKDKENEYVLSFNGCALTENKGNRLLAFEGLDFDIARQLFEFGLNRDVCIHVYTLDDVYVYRFNDDERERFHRQGTHYTELREPSIAHLKDEPIAKVLYENLDVPYLMSLDEEMLPITEGRLCVSYSSNRYVEFNRLGVDKGTALLKLASLLDIAPEETIAVGDNFNDLAMLEKAGLSVAAGNAVPEVKAVCDYVCQATHNDGVLAEVIERFVMPKKGL